MASIFFRTIIIYILLLFSIKLMGKRQIGELEVSELISALIASEIAALPIADSDIPLLNAVIPILFIVCLDIIISSIKNKSEKLKKYIDGEPSFIIYKGKLIQKSLLENRISINELLSELRLQGIGDIKDVYYAVLEQNGKVSVIERGKNGSIAHSIIIDREINQQGLKEAKKDEAWLNAELKKANLEKSDVFLMTIDDKQNINIIKKEDLKKEGGKKS